jgi:hypothetical protein
LYVRYKPVSSRQLLQDKIYFWEGTREKRFRNPEELLLTFRMRFFLSME